MFNRNSIYFKQVQLLVSVLPIVNQYDDFALKGGTAINLFLRNLPRLSIDIDLVYLPVESRLTSFDNITKLLVGISHDIEDRTSAKVQIREATQKLIVIGKDVQIKIEVSQIRGCVLVIENRDINTQVEEIFGFSVMRLLNPKEIYAGKICAALDRQHPRDLFDVMLFLKKETIDKEFMDVLMIYLISSNRPISELLNPRFKDIKTTYKNHFRGMTSINVNLEDLIQTRYDLLKIISTNCAPQHKQFLLDFKSGKLNWGTAVYPNAQHLPSVKWKELNLTRMTTSKRKDSIIKLEKVLTVFSG